MKVDEPNTPYIRYDPVADKVTNWEGMCLQAMIRQQGTLLIN